MMTLSHLTISGAATAAILQTTDPTLIAIGAIAGLLPDVDISVSPAGTILFPISTILEKYFPHRGPTHSLFGSAIVAILTYPFAIKGLFPIEFAHAVSIGYFFGYFADCFTKSGAQIFWPFDKAPWWCPDNHRLRLSTGSKAEYAVLAIILAITFLIFSINNRGGFALEFGRLIGTTSGIEQVYNRYGATNQIIVKVEGYRQIDRQPINQEFTLIAQHGQGFLVTDGSIIFKAGTEPDANLVSDRLTAKEGKKAATIIKPVQIYDQNLGEILAGIYNSYPGQAIYISGQITIDDPEEFQAPVPAGQFPVIQKADSVVRLESCPIVLAYELLREQWGVGNITARAIKIQS